MKRTGRLIALILLLAPTSAAGQAPSPERWEVPHWVGDVTFVSANALLGGLTAGIQQRLRGGSFGDGFARGALGGAVAFAGRRVAAASFHGAGLLGRELGAVGSSMVRNAGARRASLERLFLPVGPIHVYWDRAAEKRLKAKVDGLGLVVLLTAIRQPELEFDVSRSLSAGAPVFSVPGRTLRSDGEPVNGGAVAGLIILSGASRADPEAVFAHERVHVLQQDFFFHAWTDPVEGWALGRTRLGSAVYRYVDPNVVHLLLAIVLPDIDHENDPQEIEAGFLEER